jgi:hypothetical protein
MDSEHLQWSEFQHLAMLSAWRRNMRYFGNITTGVHTPHLQRCNIRKE